MRCAGMRRLVLLGGGHAHLAVLQALASRPLANREVWLVTPRARQFYSGMLPGWIAGHYGLDEFSIDLRALARRANVTLKLDAAASLDASRRVLRTAAGDEITYDTLSIDVGSDPATEALPGAAHYSVAVRPLDAFIAQWPTLVERLRGRCSRFDVSVLGSGAAGLELAFALRHRGMVEGWSHLHVHLVGPHSLPLPDAPAKARHMAVDLLRRRCIHWHPKGRVVGLDATGLHLSTGEVLRTDACWLVTGAAPPRWLSTSGLALDSAGFIVVNPSLQSITHPEVFAAGDVAAHLRMLPKSGVYAVRSGPALARNLRAHCEGRPLVPWTPQQLALSLVSTGDRHAMAIWGGRAWQGKIVWRWKDAIDRRFVRSNQVGVG